jgi:2-polyprenyl-3-methyl-5-hydroxy-6-metoxy-1,4-benzoquinol methylase
MCSSTDEIPMFDKLEHHFVRCGECGLERISPQPAETTLAQIYGEHYYDAWGLHDDVQTVAKLKRRTFERVLAKLPHPSRGTKLLDCGAATGFLLEVAQEQGYNPFALELSEFGANAIAEKFGADHVSCSEFEQLTFPGVEPGQFGVVTMCDYIEHVRDPRRVLELARKWLGINGSLVITTPDAGSLSHNVLGSGWTHYKVEHLFYFNKRTLTRLLYEAGFSTVHLYPLWKSLTLDYIRHQFEVYPHPALTRAARALRRMPEVIRALPLPFRTGELLAVAS